MNESHPGGLRSGSNWEALWKNLGVLSELYSMFQILHSFKLTWKSFEEKLGYLCSRNKTNWIKESKREQNKCVLSTLMKFDLRSPEERENYSHQFSKGCPSTSINKWPFFFLSKSQSSFKKWQYPILQKLKKRNQRPHLPLDFINWPFSFSHLWSPPTYLKK